MKIKHILGDTYRFDFTVEGYRFTGNFKLVEQPSLFSVTYAGQPTKTEVELIFSRESLYLHLPIDQSFWSMIKLEEGDFINCLQDLIDLGKIKADSVEQYFRSHIV